MSFNKPTKDRRFWGNDDRRIKVSDHRFDVTKHKTLADEERGRAASDQGRFSDIAKQAENVFNKFKEP